jgi:hypothetical protein
VTWGPGEEGLAERVVAASAGAARRAFPTTLMEYVELARQARLVVAGDTGPLHLACAVGAPVVALFGPTDPARNGPFSPRDVVVRPPSLEAAGRRGRYRIEGAVMGEIGVEQVLSAVDRRLAPDGAAMPSRLRVPFGYVLGVVVLLLAHPVPTASRPGSDRAPRGGDTPVGLRASTRRARSPPAAPTRTPAARCTSEAS